MKKSLFTPVEKIRIYFEKIYPEREGRWSKFFRKGEARRIDFARSYLNCTEGLRVLDIGSGDGFYLLNILKGMPKQITLCDFSEKNLLIAKEKKLSDSDPILVQGDGFGILEKGEYELVVAVGVLDYWPDWPFKLLQFETHLISNALISIPHSSGVRQRLRKVWLGMNGIELQTVSYCEISHMLNKLKRRYFIEKIGDDWFIFLPSQVG